jgi:hypothetical protein
MGAHHALAADQALDFIDGNAVPAYVAAETDGTDRAGGDKLSHPAFGDPEHLGDFRDA